MPPEFINVQSVIAEMAMFHERMLVEQQRFAINSAKNLKRARWMYRFISGLHAFPPQLAEALRLSIATEDYEKIQEVSKQVMITIGQLLRKNSC